MKMPLKKMFLEEWAGLPLIKLWEWKWELRVLVIKVQRISKHE